MSSLSPRALALSQAYGTPDPGVDWERVAAILGYVLEQARPLDDWHEDHGPVLWWTFPIEEAPYIGTPLDLGRTMRVRICCGRDDNEIELTHDEPGGGWPGYHTHWTPLPPPPDPPAANPPALPNTHEPVDFTRLAGG